MDADKILESLQSTGLYQKRLLAVIFLFSLGNAWGPLTVVFVLYEPEYRCKRNESMNATLPSSGPIGEDPVAACDRVGNSSTSQTSCTEWIFDTENDGGETVVSEMNLVCDKSWIAPLVVSIMMVARALGLVISGAAADRYGRRPVLLLSSLLVLIATVGMAFSRTIYTYGLFLTLCGMSSAIQNAATLVIGMEMVVPKLRNFVVFTVDTGYVIGYATLPLIAYLSPDWHILLYVVSIGSLVFISGYWYCPETIHWLVSNGDMERAELLVKKIARTNKLDPATIDSTGGFLSSSSEKGKNGTATPLSTIVASLIKVPTMRVRLLVGSFVQFVASLTYYAITLNTSFLPGDRYINCLVSAVLEVPSSALAYWLLDRIGRPKTSLLFFVASSISCASVPLVQKASPIWVSAMVITGKTAISGAFYAAQAHATEIAPTMARNLFVNICGAFSNVGSILSPYIMYLGRTTGSELFPYLFMAVFSIVAGFLAIVFLPETVGTHLPDTVEQALDQKTLFQMRAQSKRKKKPEDVKTLEIEEMGEKAS